MSFTLLGILNSQATGGLVVEGGTVTEVGGFIYHTFTSSSTLTVSGGDLENADILIVAGGGGGAEASLDNDDTAGGGGAGGYRELASQTISEGSYTVTVGAGGAVDTNGSDTSLGALGTVVGGGRGGPYFSQGISGGSGGGAGAGLGDSGGGSTADGNNGGAGGDGSAGGGGGAGAAGTSGTSQAGDGGDGSQWLDGNFYAGGGGGAGYVVGYGFATGGLGGGGRGAYTRDQITPTAGEVNTGGGGGGGARSDFFFFDEPGKPGGSGIVIVRFPV